MKRYVRILAFLGAVLFYQSSRRIFSSRMLKMGKDVSKVELELPDEFANLIDLKDYFNPEFDKRKVTPFFWHIAKAAGTTLQYYYCQCYRLKVASEIGASESSNGLEIVQVNGGKNHINVDTSNVQGILHAKEVGLVSSHIAQLVVSPLFHDATTELFSDHDKGVMFAMFRHPVKRVISLFYYLQTATWEVTYNPALANMTIEEYADSPLIESNFITRSLVNKMEGPLSVEDIKLAKEIIRRKCFIGIVEEFDTSMKMFNDAFGFRPNLSVEVQGEESADKSTKEASIKECTEALQSEGGTNRHNHTKVKEGSKAYETIERKNSWDLMLWDFIVDQYKEQQLKVMEKDLGFQGFHTE